MNQSIEPTRRKSVSQGCPDWLILEKGLVWNATDLTWFTDSMPSFPLHNFWIDHEGILSHTLRCTLRPLAGLLNNFFSPALGGDEFSLSACRSMVSHMDLHLSGSFNYDEFETIWPHIKTALVRISVSVLRRRGKMIDCESALEKKRVIRLYCREHSSQTASAMVSWNRSTYEVLCSMSVSRSPTTKFQYWPGGISTRVTITGNLGTSSNAYSNFSTYTVGSHWVPDKFTWSIIRKLHQRRNSRLQIRKRIRKT